MSNKRSNLWICVIYPDSMPDNAFELIQSWHIPVALSPLHDKDRNGDNTEKKKHYHLMLDFGSGQNKSYDQVRNFTDQLNGTIPIICHNRAAMIRYFVHLDNPEKKQYSKDDIILFSGFDIKDSFSSFTNDSIIYDHIERIIYDNTICNYAYLVKYLRDNNLLFELDFLRRHSSHINYILNGYFHLLKNGRKKLDNLKKSI